MRYYDRTLGTDSLVVECSGGPAITTLRAAYLWGQPLTGGGWRIVDSLAVVGMEGQADSFPAPWAGHFYVTTRNGAGLSCASNPAYIPDSTVTTGVGEGNGGPYDPMVRSRLFDVHGRVVTGPLGAGVYFEKRWHRSGRTTTRKVAVLK